jgi:hypothetical protein
MKRALALVLLACICWTLPAAAAEEQSPAAAYGEALADLKRGADNAAIDRLELLADRGFNHPDASLLRAAAYLSRAEGAAARPGDLGRAAAALSEVLVLRPDDEQAQRALESVQAEIARRRAKRGASVTVRPRLARAVVALLPEQAWAAVAALGSLALALGLVVRRLSTRDLWRLSGVVAASVGAVVVCLFGALTYAAMHLRTSSRPAVVVVPEARLLDEQGRALPAQRGEDSSSVPEGATVYVHETRAGRHRIEWGSLEAWLEAGSVRLLAQP